MLRHYLLFSLCWYLHTNGIKETLVKLLVIYSANKSSETNFYEKSWCYSLLQGMLSRKTKHSIKLVSPKNGINESGKLLMALNLNLKNVFLAGSMMK